MELVWTPWPEIADRLRPILDSWKGTPYREGQRCCQVGVDCVRFVCAVLDELYGYKRSACAAWPQDGGWHNREGAMKVVKFMKKVYAPVDRIVNGVVCPADVLILGPSGGGPAHVMIVGPDPNTLWHSDQRSGVRFTGITLNMKLFRVYRTGDPSAWLS